MNVEANRNFHMNDSAGAWLMHEHVDRFNAGVTAGDFGPMLEAFSDDAEMVFEGVPVGPFHGREAIAAAYREQPPDGQIKVLDVTEPADGEVVAQYAWTDRPETPSGEMRLTHHDGRITRLVVTLSPPAATGRD